MSDYSGVREGGSWLGSVGISLAIGAAIALVLLSAVAFMVYVMVTMIPFH